MENFKAYRAFWRTSSCEFAMTAELKKWRRILGIILHYCYFLTRHLSQICAQRWEGENGQDGHSHLFFSPSFLWSLTLTHKLLAFHACLCLQPNCKKQRGGRCNWLVVASHHHLREVGRGCKSRVMGGGGGGYLTLVKHITVVKTKFIHSSHYQLRSMAIHWCMCTDACAQLHHLGNGSQGHGAANWLYWDALNR